MEEENTAFPLIEQIKNDGRTKHRLNSPIAEADRLNHAPELWERVAKVLPFRFTYMRHSTPLGDPTIVINAARRSAAGYRNSALARVHGTTRKRIERNHNAVEGVLLMVCTDDELRKIGIHEYQLNPRETRVLEIFQRYSELPELLQQNRHLRRLARANSPFTFLVNELSTGKSVKEILTDSGICNVPQTLVDKWSELFVNVLVYGKRAKGGTFHKFLRNLVLARFGFAQTDWYGRSSDKRMLEATLSVLQMSPSDKGKSSYLYYLQTFLRILPLLDIQMAQRTPYLANDKKSLALIIPGLSDGQLDPYRFDPVAYYSSYLDAGIIPKPFLWIARIIANWGTSLEITQEIPALNKYSIKSRRMIVSSGLRFMVNILLAHSTYSAASIRRSRHKELKQLIKTYIDYIQKGNREVDSYRKII